MSLYEADAITSQPSLPHQAEKAKSEASSAEAALWMQFAQAESGLDFCQSWLTILCRFLPKPRGAVLLLEEDSERGQYKIGAAWPDKTHDLTYLAPAAERALKQRCGLIHRSVAGNAGVDLVGATTQHVAYPVDVSGRLHGVVVVDIGARSAHDCQTVLRQLHWGIGWLEALFRRRQALDDSTALERTTFAFAMLQAAQEQKRVQASAMTVANTLAARLSCRRVSIGFVRRNSIRLAAVSHVASFQADGAVSGAIENAMEEALDQHASVTWPARSQDVHHITLAHQTLSKMSGGGAVASVELSHAGRRIGVVTLERDAPEFDASTLKLLELTAELLAPAMELKLSAHRLVSGRIADLLADGLTAVFGPRRPGAKLIALLCVAAIGGAPFVKSDFRISGTAVIEAAQQHAIVAPNDAFVATASARAGDIVGSGQVLARLDDHELRLDAVRAESAIAQASFKYSDALGKKERTAARVAQAEIEEASAHLAIINDNIARSSLTSPFAGLIVSGDLSQMIGSPVEKGKVLFEIAPLDTYRVALAIDERDIASIKPGQSGHLVLAGLTNRSLSFLVRTVTPVAEAADGRNSFRVEADLQDPSRELRPGMEGIGKITVERRSTLAIWIRPVLAWLRVTWWTWMP